jgi:predicted phosphodiesterase
LTEAESVKIIQFSHPGDTVHIYPIGDVHLGSVFCDEKELRKTVQRVKDDLDAYVILMGDMLDMTTKTSVGDIWSQTLTPWQQIDRAAELLEPIKDRIVAVTEGNHEDRAFKFDGLLPMRQVAMQLHLDPAKVYAPCAGLIDVRLEVPASSAHMTIYFKHGYGGGRTMGAKANRMKDLKNEVMADVLIMGHTHEQMAFTSASRVPRLNSGRLYLDEMRHLHINSNSFLAWGGYATKQGYAPGFTGCPVLELTAKRTPQKVLTSASVRIST